MPSVQNSEIPFNRSTRQTYAEPVPIRTTTRSRNTTQPPRVAPTARPVRIQTQVSTLQGISVFIISVIIIVIFLGLLMSSSGFRYDQLIMNNKNIHVVRSGESLSIIAQQYGTTVEELYRLNRETITDLNLIHPGQELRLPSTGNRER